MTSTSGSSSGPRMKSRKSRPSVRATTLRQTRAEASRAVRVRGGASARPARKATSGGKRPRSSGAEAAQRPAGAADVRVAQRQGGQAHERAADQASEDRKAGTLKAHARGSGGLSAVPGGAWGGEAGARSARGQHTARPAAHAWAAQSRDGQLRSR